MRKTLFRWSYRLRRMWAFELVRETDKSYSYRDFGQTKRTNKTNHEYRFFTERADMLQFYMTWRENEIERLTQLLGELGAEAEPHILYAAAEFCGGVKKIKL